MMYAIDLLNREITILENNLEVFDQEGRDDEARFAEQQLVDLRKALAGLKDGSINWRARKIGGSFEHTGTVIAVFQTTSGESRLVLEFDAPVQGMLHIYRPDQVSFL